MKRSILESATASSYCAVATRIGTLVAILLVPACGGPEAYEDIAARTEAITWTSPAGDTHDYLFFKMPAQTAIMADQICFESGAYLAAINTSAEQAFISHEIGLQQGGIWWIGYSDDFSEGLWNWEDGSPNGYVNWASGQHVNATGNEDWAAIDGSTGLWSAVDGGNSFSYVCERGTNFNVKATFDYSGTDTNYALQNYASWAVDVHWGLNVGTCGLPSAAANGDTFLRVYDQNGVEVGEDDDACGTNDLASNVSVGSNACSLNACTWYVHAGCWSSSSCSGTVALNPF